MQVAEKGARSLIQNCAAFPAIQKAPPISHIAPEGAYGIRSLSMMQDYQKSF